MKLTGTYGIYVIEDEPFNDQGRFGRLFRISSPPGYVYKAYYEPITEHQARKQLLRIRQLGREVLVKREQIPGLTPESSINWPIDSVERRGLVNGVVIPEIPGRFFRPNGKPRTLDFLHMRRADTPPAWGRVSVLTRLAAIFRWLAEKRLVHGDLSFKNVVWCSDPEPGAYLIDCDGLRELGSRATTGVATDGWIDPRLVEGAIKDHDQFSDWFALGLAMYRGLLLNRGYLSRNADGSWPVPRGFPKGLDARVRDHIRRTLSHPLDVHARTPPGQWVETLIATYMPDGRFDDAALRVLDEYAGTTLVAATPAAKRRRRAAPRPARPAGAPPRRSTPHPAPTRASSPTPRGPTSPPPGGPRSSASSPLLLYSEELLTRLGAKAVPAAGAFAQRAWVFTAGTALIVGILGIVPLHSFLISLLLFLVLIPGYWWLGQRTESILILGVYGVAASLVSIGEISIWLLFLVSTLIASAWLWANHA
jgi:hypothetical protein